MARQRVRTGNELEAYHGRNIMDLMQARAPASRLRAARHRAESVQNPVRDFHNRQRRDTVKGGLVAEFPGFPNAEEAKRNDKRVRKDKADAKWEGKPVPFVGLPADRVDHREGVGRQIRGRPTQQLLDVTQMVFRGAPVRFSRSTVVPEPAAESSSMGAVRGSRRIHPSYS